MLFPRHHLLQLWVVVPLAVSQISFKVLQFMDNHISFYPKPQFTDLLTARFMFSEPHLSRKKIKNISLALNWASIFSSRQNLKFLGPAFHSFSGYFDRHFM